MARAIASKLGEAPSKLTRGYDGRFRIQSAENPSWTARCPRPWSRPWYTLDDPRGDRTKLHHLTDILVLSVLAVICGADSSRPSPSLASSTRPGCAPSWRCRTGSPRTTRWDGFSRGWMRPASRRAFGTGCGRPFGGTAFRSGAVRTTARRPTMSIEITGINHGLSVHTTADGTIGADTIDNRRLRWPVPQEGSIIVYNTFNDATSGDFYKYPAGHEGIDFLCADTAVEAMYGGVVTEIKRDWRSAPRRSQQLRHHPFLHGPCHRYRIRAHVCPSAIDRGEHQGRTRWPRAVPGIGSPNLHVHLRTFERRALQQSAK